MLIVHKGGGARSCAAAAGRRKREAQKGGAKPAARALWLFSTLAVLEHRLTSTCIQGSHCGGGVVYCDHQENRKSVVGCEHFIEEEELASSSFKLTTLSFASKPGPKIVRDLAQAWFRGLVPSRFPGPSSGPARAKLGGPRAELGPVHCVERQSLSLALIETERS